MPERLYRSRRERMIGGVASGIAESLRIDPTIVRIAWVLLALATNGLAILVYFVLLFIVPEAPEELEAPADGTGPTAGATAGGVAAHRPAALSSRSRSGPRFSEPRGDGRTGALVAGTLLIVGGGYFLVRQYLPSFDLSLRWPLIAIGLGAILIVASLWRGGRSS